MASPEIISTSQLDRTFGCLFLSGIFSSTLWGVGCLQLWLYYEKHSMSDRCWLKIHVFLIWALDVAHQVMVLQYLYSVFVDGIANPLNLGRFSKSGIYTAILTALIDAMVQIIFLQRIWFISKKNKVVTGILCASVLGQFAGAMTDFGQIYNFTELAQLATVVLTGLVVNSISAATDTLLAITLIYFLRRSCTGFRKTDTIVNRLIAYAIGTGLITALWQIAALISAEVAPNTFVYLIFDLVVPKLYFNCMLASLNARSSLRETLADASAGLSIQLEGSTAIGSSNNSRSFTRKSAVTMPIERTIGIETESHGDHPQKGGSSFFNFDATTTSPV